MTTLILPRSHDSLRTSLADVASGMPGTFAVDRERTLGLRENERAIVRLFGSQALSEIRDVGARCVGDGAFAAQVSRLRSPESDPEGWLKLARVMPDYLIASHTLRTFLAGAVTPEFHRGIPNDGKSLVGVALGLQRFSSQPELQMAVHAEREHSLVPLTEPIWSRLPLSFFDTYRDRQRAAYETRLKIQPGGSNILASLRNESNFSRNLTRVITASLVHSTAQLDPHDRGHIRALAREFHSKHWNPISPEEISNGRIRGLRASDGSIFSPPPELLEKVSTLHHQAWCEARALVAGIPDAPRSPLNMARALPRGIPPELLKYNLDGIAALTWILEIGLLEDERDNEPRRGVSSTRESLTEEPPVQARTLPHTQEPTVESPAALPAAHEGVLVGREIEHPQNIQLIRRIQGAVTRSLYERDLSDLQPVMIVIDHLPGNIREPRFVRIIEQLRGIHAHRKALIESITLGLLSSDRDRLQLLMPDTLSSDSRCSMELHDVIPQSQRGNIQNRMRTLRDTKERLVDTLGGDAARLQALTELLNPAQLQAERPAIKALMMPHIAQYGTQKYRDFGGIFGEKSYLDALQTHCAEEGSILVRRKDAVGGRELDGMFMYGKLGVYPAQIAQLLTTIAPHGDLSFASLFITALDRAPGTYMSLLRGMAARLALQGARYSLGTVGEANLKHHNLLVSLDHLPLRGATLLLPQYHARFIPMLWELP